MKKIFLLVTCTCSLLKSYTQNVGIGTNSPDNSAILDISSVDKGLMLPRLSDTTAITNPKAGLVIYNQAMRMLSLHDGIQWRNLNSTVVSSNQDSITISINGGAETPVRSYEQETSRTLDGNGLPNSGPKAGRFNFTKKNDVNSTILKERCFNSIQTLATVIFKFYDKTSGSVYYQVKFETAYVYGCKDSVDPTNGFIEYYSITAKKIEIGSIQYSNQWPI